MIPKQSIFIWNDPVVGNADTITRMLVDAGFDGALLHWQNLATWRTPSRIALARSLQAAGLQVYGSAAVYGIGPVTEGKQAAAIVNEFGLDGFVFDAEVGFDSQPTADSNAINMLRAYKAATNKPSVWCWWSHYKDPWDNDVWQNKAILAAAMTEADYGMPMAYWWFWQNTPKHDTPESAVEYLESCLEQWRKVSGNKPIVPAGRAFVGGGGSPRADAIAAFAKRAWELGACGLTWWSMEHAIALPGIWAALKAVSNSNGGAEPPIEEPTMAWTSNAIGLYTKTAGWTNKDFKFIVGYAGGIWSQRADGAWELAPNPALKAIEEQAHAEGKPFIALWDFDVSEYALNQIDANDSSWPPVENDYPLKAMIDALKNRAVDGLIIRVMNSKNREGKTEMMSYIGFAAGKFVDRAHKWLYQNKGAHQWTFVLTSDDFMRTCDESGVSYQETFYSWLKDWYVGIEQAATRPLASGAWPQDSDRIRAIPPSLGWKFWAHYQTANLSMMIFNGDDATMRTFLGYKTTTTPPPPPPDDDEPPAGTTTLAQRLTVAEAEINALKAKLAAVKAAL